MKTLILAIVIILSGLTTAGAQTASDADSRQIMAELTAMETEELGALDSLETLYRNTTSEHMLRKLTRRMSECDKALSFISALRAICSIDAESSTTEEIETALRQICSMRKSSYAKEGLIDSLTTPYIMLMAERKNPLALNLMGLRAMERGEYYDANGYFAEAATGYGEGYLPALHNYSMSSLYLSWMLRKEGNIEEADRAFDIAQKISGLYTDYMVRCYGISTDKSATGPHTAAEYYLHEPNASGSDNDDTGIRRLLRGETLAGMIKAPRKKTGNGISGQIGRRSRAGSGRKR